MVGSNGLVGSAVSRNLEKSKKVTELIKSTRKDTDLFSFNETNKLITSTKPDIIIMSAAKVGGIMANNTQRTEFIIENLKINMNIFESCLKNKNIRIINLGSSCIYPLNAPNPIKEEYFMNGKLEPTNSPYAMAKIAAIEIGDAVNKQYGNEVINLMPTNLYGPNDNFDPKTSHVIPGLIQKFHKSKLKNNKYLRVWGSGRPLREFLHVDDLSDAIVFLMKKVNAYEVYDKKISQINIGSGDEISIKNLAYILKDIVGYKGQIVFDESMPDGTPRKLLDCSFLKEKGWVSSTPLDSGLNDLYEFYKKKIENRQSK